MDKEQAVFGRPSYILEVCKDHYDDNLIECVYESKGVYRMYHTICDTAIPHDCDCDRCDAEPEYCGANIKWRLFDQIDEILCGDGSPPYINRLIENGKILPLRAYQRLFE